MGKVKALVRVKVFKIFEYTKSMLHKDLFMQDAMSKARSDMQTFVDEITQNDHAQLNHDMFLYEAEEQLGYKFRGRQVFNEDDGSKITIAKVAKMLSTSDMEKKHGPLNHEQNPSLYEHVPEVTSKDGVVLKNEQYYMKDSIANELYNIYDGYFNILRSLK